MREDVLGEDLGEVSEELALVLGVSDGEGLEDLVSHQSVVGRELQSIVVSQKDLENESVDGSRTITARRVVVSVTRKVGYDNGTH